jgi:hypothetical protein
MARQAEVVVGAVDRDVLGDVVGEGLHQRLEVLLAADFAKIPG